MDFNVSKPYNPNKCSWYLPTWECFIAIHLKDCALYTVPIKNRLLHAPTDLEIVHWRPIQFLGKRNIRQTLPPQTKTITKIVFQKLITSLLLDIQLGGPSTNWTDPFEEARTFTFCGIRPFFPSPTVFVSAKVRLYLVMRLTDDRWPQACSAVWWMVQMRLFLLLWW